MLGGAGCSGSDNPQVMLLGRRVLERGPEHGCGTGYQVSADVGWPIGCTTVSPSLPNLRLRVNDGEVTPMVYGNCRLNHFARLLLGAFQQDLPITTVRAGAATMCSRQQYDHLFPGANAQLVMPADGQVKTGDPDVARDPVQPVAADVTYTEFYWLDTRPDVPPFTPSERHAGPRRFDVPDHRADHHRSRGGRAQDVFDANFGVASSCTGFQSCTAEPNNDTMGPVFMKIIVPLRLVAIAVGPVHCHVAALIAGLACGWAARRSSH